MRLLWAMLCAGIPCGVASVAHAQPTATAPTGVSVDWSEVDDADVTRCRLGGLRSGTIERLVDDGYALVDTPGPEGIAVRVGSAQSGLRIRVQGGGGAREATVPLPESCDATLVLDVIAHIAELVDEVHAALPPATPPATSSSPGSPGSPGGDVAQTPAVTLSIDLAGRLSLPGDWLAGGGDAIRRPLSTALALGGRAELVATRSDGVTVLEALLAAAGLWSLTPWVGFYAEVGPLLHHGASDERTYTGLDGWLAAGVQANIDPVVVQLLLSARARRFVHRASGRDIFDSGYLGLIARVGWQLFGD